MERAATMPSIKMNIAAPTRASSREIIPSRPFVPETPKPEGPVKNFSFTNTVPYIVPTEPTVLPKTKAVPPKQEKTSIQLPETKQKPEPPLIPLPRRSFIAYEAKPTIPEKAISEPEVERTIASIRSELTNIAKTDNPTKGVRVEPIRETQPVIPEQTGEPTLKNKSTAETTLTQQVAVLYQEKGLPNTLQLLEKNQTLPKTTILRAVHTILEQKVTAGELISVHSTDTAQKRQEQLFFLAAGVSLPENLTKEEQTKEPVIDERAESARQRLIVGVILQRFIIQEMFGSTANPVISGKELVADLPKSATDSLISGLAAQYGVQDGSYLAWMQNIATLPEGNMWNVMYHAIQLIDRQPPVKLSETGKRVNDTAVALVLGAINPLDATLPHLHLLKELLHIGCVEK